VVVRALSNGASMSTKVSVCFAMMDVLIFWSKVAKALSTTPSKGATFAG
jgi:hypothetical protein